MKYPALSLALIAMSVALAGCASQEPANGIKPKRLTTDLYIEGGVDRSNMPQSWIDAREFDVIGMPNPSSINQSGQSYPALRP